MQDEALQVSFGHGCGCGPAVQRVGDELDKVPSPGPLRPVTEVLAEAKNFRLPDEDNPEVQRWLREMGVGDADK